MSVPSNILKIKWSPGRPHRITDRPNKNGRGNKSSCGQKRQRQLSPLRETPLLESAWTVETTEIDAFTALTEVPFRLPNIPPGTAWKLPMDSVHAQWMYSFVSEADQTLANRILHVLDESPLLLCVRDRETPKPGWFTTGTLCQPWLAPRLQSIIVIDPSIQSAAPVVQMDEADMNETKEETELVVRTDKTHKPSTQQLGSSSSSTNGSGTTADPFEPLWLLATSETLVNDEWMHLENIRQQLSTHYQLRVTPVAIMDLWRLHLIAMHAQLFRLADEVNAPVQPQQQQQQQQLPKEVPKMHGVRVYVARPWTELVSSVQAHLALDGVVFASPLLAWTNRMIGSEETKDNKDKQQQWCIVECMVPCYGVRTRATATYYREVVQRPMKWLYRFDSRLFVPDSSMIYPMYVWVVHHVK